MEIENSSLKKDLSELKQSVVENDPSKIHKTLVG